MCGPFKVDYSFINGREIIGRSEFVDFDVEAALASHSAVMDRIYRIVSGQDLAAGSKDYDVDWDCREASLDQCCHRPAASDITKAAKPYRLLWLRP